VKADVLVMVDNDMGPAPGFLPFAVRHLAERRGPIAVGSPYCGAAPDHDVQVMGLRDYVRVPRQAAARREGVEIVGAIGTGLFAVNVAAFDLLQSPYFAYEYTTAAMTALAGTEDFVFCRNLTTAGGRVYCAWDHWSTHYKIEAVGKPEIETETEATR
jgi:hypothetical protein